MATEKDLVEFFEEINNESDSSSEPKSEPGGEPKGFECDLPMDDEEVLAESQKVSMFCRNCLHPYFGEKGKGGSIILKCKSCNHRDIVTEDDLADAEPVHSESLAIGGNLIYSRFSNILLERNALRQINPEDPNLIDDDFKAVSEALPKIVSVMKQTFIEMQKITEGHRIVHNKEMLEVLAKQGGGEESVSSDGVTSFTFNNIQVYGSEETGDLIILPDKYKLPEESFKNLVTLGRKGVQKIDKIVLEVGFTLNQLRQLRQFQERLLCYCKFAQNVSSSSSTEETTFENNTVCPSETSESKKSDICEQEHNDLEPKNGNNIDLNSENPNSNSEEDNFINISGFKVQIERMKIIDTDLQDGNDKNTELTSCPAGDTSEPTQSCVSEQSVNLEPKSCQKEFNPHFVGLNQEDKLETDNLNQQTETSAFDTDPNIENRDQFESNVLSTATLEAYESHIHEQSIHSEPMKSSPKDSNSDNFKLKVDENTDEKAEEISVKDNELKTESTDNSDKNETENQPILKSENENNSSDNKDCKLNEIGANKPHTEEDGGCRPKEPKTNIENDVSKIVSPELAVFSNILSSHEEQKKLCALIPDDQVVFTMKNTDLNVEAKDAFQEVTSSFTIRIMEAKQQRMQNTLELIKQTGQNMTDEVERIQASMVKELQIAYKSKQIKAEKQRQQLEETQNTLEYYRGLIAHYRQTGQIDKLLEIYELLREYEYKN